MSAKAKVKGCTHVSSVRAKQTSKRDTDAPAGPKKKGGTTMSEVHLPPPAQRRGHDAGAAGIGGDDRQLSRPWRTWVQAALRQLPRAHFLAAVPLREVRHHLRDKTARAGGGETMRRGEECHRPPPRDKHEPARGAAPLRQRRRERSLPAPRGERGLLLRCGKRVRQLLNPPDRAHDGDFMS